MATDVKLVPESELHITSVSNISPVNIASVHDIAPINIDRVQHIAPVAAHIKEINHIDPISVDSLYVNQVRNIEPIVIERFNVTNLPMVNMSLRQLPPVDLNVRRVPPVSIGSHQDFRIPSNYTVRARFLGIEFLRIHLDGHTTILPKERARREQAQTHDRSFPETATAGNPAIPSVCRETGMHVHSLPPVARTFQARCSPRPGPSTRPRTSGWTRTRRPMPGAGMIPAPEKSGSLSYGLPRVHFDIAPRSAAETGWHSSVRSGE
jgi:hypothetical protein